MLDFKAISTAFKGLAAEAREMVLSKEELKSREEAKQFLAMGKVAALAVAATSVVFFALLPCIFTLVLAALTSFTAKEVYQVADNALDMLNNPLREGLARLTKKTFGDHLTKGTLVAGLILQAANPSFEGIVFISDRSREG